MTIFATTVHRGGQVTIPVTSGGCGATHRYEDTPSGYPGITCPQCEEVLRGDPQHAAAAAKVPETYDEQLNREHADKTGRAERDSVSARALAAIAGLPLAMAAPQGGPPCPDGHPNPEGSKFCGHCGSPMGPPPCCPGGHQIPSGMKFCGQCGQPPAARQDAGPATRPARAGRGTAAA